MSEKDVIFWSKPRRSQAASRARARAKDVDYYVRKIS